MKIAVVGSGPSGVAAAATLLEQGHAVDLLDVGNTPEASAQALAAEVREAARDGGRPSAALFRALRQGPGGSGGSPFAGLSTLLGRVEPERSQKRILGSHFVWEDAERGIPLESGSVTRSLARGGLSNAWGAACYPWRESDFEGWPVAAADLAPHYSQAARWLGLDQPNDGLARAYPLLGPAAPDTPRNPGSVLEALLGRWRSREPELAAAGFAPGRARLAVQPADAGDGACQRCGLCFYGCAFGAIWHAGQLLARIEGHDSLRYRPGHFVSGFRETAGQVEVHGMADSQRFAERYDALVLAAGVLSSLRIAADSLGEHGRPTPLLDNDLFLAPLVSLQRGPAWGFRTRFTLGEAVLALEAGVVSPRPLHLQFYSFHEFFLAELGDWLRALPRVVQDAVWAVLNRLVLGFLYLPGEDSTEATAQVIADSAGGPGRVRIETRPRPESVALRRALLSHLSRLRGPLGLWPIPGLVKSTPFGFHGHLAGTLPMRSAPSALESDAEGRLAGAERVFVVDSAVFPTLPAQNLTFTAMANARRVASGLAEGLL
jgi:choline dehydrogenase-like flavoprotein